MIPPAPKRPPRNGSASSAAAPTDATRRYFELDNPSIERRVPFSRLQLDEYLLSASTAYGVAERVHRLPFQRNLIIYHVARLLKLERGRRAEAFRLISGALDVGRRARAHAVDAPNRGRRPRFSAVGRAHPNAGVRPRSNAKPERASRRRLRMPRDAVVMANTTINDNLYAVRSGAVLLMGNDPLQPYERPRGEAAVRRSERPRRRGSAATPRLGAQVPHQTMRRERLFRRRHRDARVRAGTKLRSAFKAQFILCTAGVLLNISAKLWRISR